MRNPIWLPAAVGWNPGTFWLIAIVLVCAMLPVRAAALTPSTTTLVSSPNPSTFGRAVTLTATVSPSAATGKVTFYDGVTVLGIGTLSTGQATLTTTLLPSGSRSLKAYYAGDSAFAASTSPAVAQTVTALPQNGFQAAVNYSAGTTPFSVAVGDFNGDGKADFAVANAGSNTVSVLLGKGNGIFQTAVSYTVGARPLSVAVGDFNGDGRADLAVANWVADSGGYVGVLLGNGDGTFQAAGNFNAGGGPNFVVVGDFNGDGKADLAVTGHVGTNVLLGNGDGTFQAGVNYGTGIAPNSVAVGDFNRDGKADLVVGDNYGGGAPLRILVGNGDGTFQAAAAVGPALGPYSGYVVVGDFNGDGKADLAATSGGSNIVGVLIGNGDGTFQAPATYSVGGNPGSPVAGDFNGDGKADLAVVINNTVSVLLGNGDGTFQTAVNYTVGNSPASVAVGDFNGDGVPDLAVANADSNTVSILLGVPVSADVGFLDGTAVPNPVQVGSELRFTFAVTNFGPVQASNVDITLPLGGLLPSLVGGLSGVSCGVVSVSSNFSYSSGIRGTDTCFAHIPVFPAGARLDVQLAGTILLTVPDRSALRLSGSLTSDTADPVPANNSVTATAVVLNPLLALLPGPQGPPGPIGPVGPQGPIGPAGGQVWSTFLAALNTTYVAATFTPDNAIKVTRIQIQLSSIPSGCTPNAYITLSDGTDGGTRVVTLTGLLNDSGPISINYSAGTAIQISVTKGSCSGVPSGGNAVVQYKAQ